VDDQADVLDTISLLLRLDGHHVRAFVSGREALEAVTVERPDLVITDLSMPAVSGWDVAQVVAQEAPGTPVIMLTGIGLAISAVEARDKGVAHVLHKPTDRETLRLAIDKVLSPTERVTSTLSVLVIDDSDDFRAAIALLLRSLGHVVVEASGVERARRHISSSSRIDVALLDVHLADGDPKEVLSLLRASRPAARAWVVSGSDVETMRTHVPDADLYIEKMELPDRLLNLSVTERE
jgi:DNA-binding NtrC family response regulator